MYGTFLENALVDQSPRPLKIDLVQQDTTNQVVLTIPHFWVNVVVDPGMPLKIFIFPLIK